MQGIGFLFAIYLCGKIGGHVLLLAYWMCCDHLISRILQCAICKHVKVISPYYHTQLYFNIEITVLNF